MAKLTLEDLANLSNQTTAIAQINANGALIEAAMENTLSRDGSSPNTMSASIDMNSKSLLNVGTIDATTITLDGISLLTSLPTVVPRGAWVTATAYVVGDLVSQSTSTYICNTAHTSGVFATDNTSGYWTTFATIPSTVKTPERFTGDDADTTFVLSAVPTSEDYISVYIDGVYQNHDQFSLSSATITFSTAPPTGTDNIEVVYTVDSTTFVPEDASITGAKLNAAIDASATPTVWTNMNIDSGSIDGVTVGAASATTGAFTTMTGTDLTLSGDLTVNGTTVSLQITNQVSADPLIELNNGAASNANDMGIIMERGSTGDNAFMGWDESGDHFIVATTTATGSSTGNISYTAADLTVAAITATSGTLAGLTSLAMSAGATLTAGFLDEDTMSSNSDVAGVTQQSVKAYVDAQVPAAGIQMTWETTTTDTDQGVGKVWLNHATPSSATVMYFDDVENSSVSINSFIDSLDDPTASNSAVIYIMEAGTGGAGVVFQVSGAVTSASTYSKVAVTHVATFGTLSDADIVGVTFAFSGNNGAGAGDMIGSNNLSDVTVAATAFANIKQAASATATGVVELATDAETNTGTDTARAITPANLTAWTGDTGVITVGTITTGVWTGTDVAVADGGTGSSTAAGAATNLGLGTGNSPQFAGIELGHATENTLSASSGVLSIEGAVVAMTGKQTIWVPVAAMRPTVSNGCSAVTDFETTAGQPDFQVMYFDGAADEHAQFAVAMPKSWNEGTVTFRAFSGVTNTAATDGTDTVSWGLQGLGVIDDGSVDQAYGTGVVVTEATSGTVEDIAVSAESTAVTIATAAVDGLTFFRVYRDVSADDMAEDAGLIGIQVFIVTDAGEDT